MLGKRTPQRSYLAKFPQLTDLHFSVYANSLLTSCAPRVHLLPRISSLTIAPFLRLNSRGYILGVLGDSQPSNQENIKLSQTGARFGQSSRGGGGDPRLGIGSGIGSQQVRIAMNRFVVTVSIPVHFPHEARGADQGLL